MDKTYYISELNPDCYFVAVGRVIVAEYLNGCWCDRCIYRPVRKYYKPIPWSGLAFNEVQILMPLEWAYVEAFGREFHSQLKG